MGLAFNAVICGKSFLSDPFLSRKRHPLVLPIHTNMLSLRDVPVIFLRYSSVSDKGGDGRKGPGHSGDVYLKEKVRNTL